MVFIKNIMIVVIFSFLVVSMIFLGVTMIEAKGKKMAQEATVISIDEMHPFIDQKS